MEEIKLLGEIRAKVDFTGQYGESQEDQGMDPKVDLDLKGNIAGLMLLLAEIQEGIGKMMVQSKGIQGRGNQVEYAVHSLKAVCEAVCEGLQKEFEHDANLS